MAQTQTATDGKLLGLVGTMDDTFSFVEDLDGLPNKIARLEDIITRILQQTAECALFIREYVRQSFAGTSLYRGHFPPIYIYSFLFLLRSDDRATLERPKFKNRSVHGSFYRASEEFRLWYASTEHLCYLEDSRCCITIT